MCSTGHMHVYHVATSSYKYYDIVAQYETKGGISLQFQPFSPCHHSSGFLSFLGRLSRLNLPNKVQLVSRNDTFG